MGWKRIKEALALVLIGDGLISILEPRRHTRLWSVGSGTYGQALRRLERRPVLAQTLGLALIGFGLWLASRQKAK